MIDFVLDWPEVLHAAHAGIMRAYHNGQNGVREMYGNRLAPGEIIDWKKNIDGCIAELAVSRLTNRRWNCPFAVRPDVAARDVGSNIQVRSTVRQDGCLILHDRDDDADVFFLVLLRHADSRGVHVRVPGWIRGADGKRAEFFMDKGNGRPAYFVPQCALNTTGLAA